MAHLKVENLSYSYPLREGRHAVLNQLNFSAERGEFISILGPSGCGKSTLLRLLSGFYRPEKGSIAFGGSALSAPFARGQMIFQDTEQLLPWLNVDRNILFPRYRSLITSVEKKVPVKDRQLLESILEKTGLLSFRKHHPSQLSGGLKQRVSLARAIFAQPEVLFLDEPFVSLDAPSRHELQNLLLDLWEKGGWTVFFVTHDIGEALILSEKMLLFSGAGKSPRMMNNPLEYPRDPHSEEFRKEKLHLYSLIESL